MPEPDKLMTAQSGSSILPPDDSYDKREHTAWVHHVASKARIDYPDVPASTSDDDVMSGLYTMFKDQTPNLTPETFKTSLDQSYGLDYQKPKKTLGETVGPTIHMIPKLPMAAINGLISSFASPISAARDLSDSFYAAHKYAELLDKPLQPGETPETRQRVIKFYHDQALELNKSQIGHEADALATYGTLPLTGGALGTAFKMGLVKAIGREGAELATANLSKNLGNKLFGKVVKHSLTGVALGSAWNSAKEATQRALTAASNGDGAGTIFGALTGAGAGALSIFEPMNFGFNAVLGGILGPALEGLGGLAGKVDASLTKEIPSTPSNAPAIEPSPVELPGQATEGLVKPHPELSQPLAIERFGSTPPDEIHPVVPQGTEAPRPVIPNLVQPTETQPVVPTPDVYKGPQETYTSPGQTDQFTQGVNADVDQRLHTELENAIDEHSALRDAPPPRSIGDRVARQHRMDELRQQIDDRVAYFAKTSEERVPNDVPPPISTGDTPIARESGFVSRVRPMTASQALGRMVTPEPTQQEAALVKQGIDGKHPVVAAKWIAEKGPSTLRPIAARVSSTLQEVNKSIKLKSIRVVGTGDQAHPSMNEPNVGGYSLILYPRMWEMGHSSSSSPIGEGEIQLKGNIPGHTTGLSFETTLHELIHQATELAITLGSRKAYVGTYFHKISTELSELTAHIQNHIYDRIHSYSPDEFITHGHPVEHAIKNGANIANNPAELLAWGLTNETVQKYLDTIPYDRGTVWNKLVDTIRRLLKLPPSQNSALTKLLEIGDKILPEDTHNVNIEHNIVHADMIRQSPPVSTREVFRARQISSDYKVAQTITNRNTDKAANALRALPDAKSITPEILSYRHSGSIWLPQDGQPIEVPYHLTTANKAIQRGKLKNPIKHSGMEYKEYSTIMNHGIPRVQMQPGTIVMDATLPLTPKQISAVRVMMRNDREFLGRISEPNGNSIEMIPNLDSYIQKLKDNFKKNVR